MNIVQTSRVLKGKGIYGFGTFGWEFIAPEGRAGDCFFDHIGKNGLSMKDYEDNIALFTLFRFYGNFKRRISGDISDSWLSKDTFDSIAQECYDILESQPDLEHWQLELKGVFKAML